MQSIMHSTPILLKASSAVLSTNVQILSLLLPNSIGKLGIVLSLFVIVDVRNSPEAAKLRLTVAKLGFCQVEDL